MKVTVARTLDDFMKVMVIRGIIFIGEHGPVTIWNSTNMN